MDGPKAWGLTLSRPGILYLPKSHFPQPAAGLPVNQKELIP